MIKDTFFIFILLYLQTSIKNFGLNVFLTKSCYTFAALVHHFMKMSKVIFALLMLLLSSNIFAFSPTSIVPADSKEDIAIPVVSENQVYVYDSTLAFFVTLQKKTYTTDDVVHSFRFCSAFETLSGSRYVKLSKYIDPGLDVPGIIFPFHIFL